MAKKEMNPGFLGSIFSSKIERFDNAETHLKSALNLLKLDKNCKIIRSENHRGLIGAS